MPKPFKPRGKTNTGYHTNVGVQTKTGFYGATVANQFVQDLILGLDSLDVVVIGDSNGGYSSAAPVSAGMTGGWEDALLARSLKPYSTALYPVGYTTAGQNYHMGNRSTLGIVANQCAIGTGQSGPAFTSLGSASGVTAVNSLWNSGSGALLPASVPLDWCYVASGQSGNNSGQRLSIPASSPLGIKNRLVYRIGSITLNTGSGSFKPVIYVNGSGSTLVTGASTSSNTGTIGYQVTETVLQADASRTLELSFSRFGANAAYNADVTGPVGFLFESVYTAIKGFAVNCLSYYSGATTGQISDGIVAAGDTVKTYLKEIRERQVRAGGSGRVLINIYTGVNDVSAATLPAYATKVDAMIQHIQSKWIALGYSMDDLAFLVVTTHPTASTDTMTTARNLGRSLAYTQAGQQTTFVNLPEVTPHATLSGSTLYANGSGVATSTGGPHLVKAGYLAVVNGLIDGLNN